MSPPVCLFENCSLVVQVAPNFPRASSRPVGARVERTRRGDRPARGRPGGSARSADALRQMRRTTRPTRALRAPRDPRRWAQGAPPPGSRDLRLLAVRESPEADAAWVPRMTDAASWNQRDLWRWARDAPPPGRRRMRLFASRVPPCAEAAWCPESRPPSLTYCRGQPCRVRGGAHRPREAPRCN